MAAYVKQVKYVINAAHNELRDVFPDIKLRCALIGYRDYDKKGMETENQIIVKQFTSNQEDFEKIVEEIKCFGGDDGAEDIFGGLEQVPKLMWLNKSRILFHVADAPCESDLNFY